MRGRVPAGVPMPARRSIERRRRRPARLRAGPSTPFREPMGASMSIRLLDVGFDDDAAEAVARYAVRGVEDGWD